MCVFVDFSGGIDVVRDTWEWLRRCVDEATEMGREYESYLEKQETGGGPTELGHSLERAKDLLPALEFARKKTAGVEEAEVFFLDTSRGELREGGLVGEIVEKGESFLDVEVQGVFWRGDEDGPDEDGQGWVALRRKVGGASGSGARWSRGRVFEVKDREELLQGWCRAGVACGGCGATWTSDDGSFWVAQGETDEGIQELQEFEVSWISAEEAAKRRRAGVETGARTRQAAGTLTVCEETGEGFCPLCGAALKGAPA